VGISYSCISSSSRYRSIRLSVSSQHDSILLRLHDRLPPDSILRRDDGRRLRDVLSQDLGPEEPGEPDEEFVADELLGRDLEDLWCVLVRCLAWINAAAVLTVNLFKRQLLGLTNEAEDHEPGYQVESCVEADCVACQ